MLDQQCTHLEVVVEEAPWGRLVGPDAADASREVNDDLWSGVRIHRLDAIFSGQIVSGASGHEHRSASSIEPLHDVRAKEA